MCKTTEMIHSAISEQYDIHSSKAVPFPSFTSNCTGSVKCGDDNLSRSEDTSIEELCGKTPTWSPGEYSDSSVSSPTFRTSSCVHLFKWVIVGVDVYDTGMKIRNYNINHINKIFRRNMTPWRFQNIIKYFIIAMEQTFALTVEITARLLLKSTYFYIHSKQSHFSEELWLHKKLVSFKLTS